MDMIELNYPAIGQRIRKLRKRRKMNQTELAQILDKSLRTVQKYESGEIEISVGVVNQIAEALGSTSAYILGYEAAPMQIETLGDVMDFLFKLEQVEGIDFSIDVQKPPRSKRWTCSITFDGKSKADFNTDICLFLEQWAEERKDLQTFNSTQAAYKEWKAETVDYYDVNAVTSCEPAELDPAERIARRNAYLESEYIKPERDI